MNTYDKYWFCMRHPAFINEDFVEVEILIDPHMVCPSTARIEEYAPLNTKIQYWVEFCPPYYDDDQAKKWVRSHDTDCDCGGWTYEEAIDNLYDLVLAKYGDYTEQDIDDKEEEVFKYSTSTSALSNYLLNPNYRAKEDRSWKEELLDDISKTYLPRDIENLENYKKALIEFMKTATMQQVEEIKLILIKVEHDLFTHRMTQKIGIIFT